MAGSDNQSALSYMTNQLNYLCTTTCYLLDLLHALYTYLEPGAVVSSPKVTPTPDYHAVLGLSRDATEQEINRAWRKAVLLHHPDKRGPNNSSNTSDRHQQDSSTGASYIGLDIRVINEAKWVLSDAGRRRDWEDRFYSSGMSPCPRVSC